MAGVRPCGQPLDANMLLKYLFLNPIDPKYTNSTTHLILIYALKNEFLIWNWKLIVNGQII